MNVYELLAELLESSGVDRLDTEDPVRMRASAQAKLAEITEVQNYLPLAEGELTVMLSWTSALPSQADLVWNLQITESSPSLKFCASHAHRDIQ